MKTAGGFRSNAAWEGLFITPVTCLSNHVTADYSNFTTPWWPKALLCKCSHIPAPGIQGNLKMQVKVARGIKPTLQIKLNRDLKIEGQIESWHPLCGVPKKRVGADLCGCSLFLLQAELDRMSFFLNVQTFYWGFRMKLWMSVVIFYEN